MKEVIKESSRREFLKKCGLSTASFLLPVTGLNGASFELKKKAPSQSQKMAVNFIYDGLSFSPNEYLEKLQELRAYETMLIKGCAEEAVQNTSRTGDVLTSREHQKNEL